MSYRLSLLGHQQAQLWSKLWLCFQTIPTCHTTAVVVTVSGNSSLLTSPTNAGYDQEIPPPEALQGFAGNAHQSYGAAPPTYDMHGNPGAAVPQPGYGEDNLAFAQQPYEQPPPYGPPSDCTPAQMAPEFRDPTPQLKWEIIVGALCVRESSDQNVIATKMLNCIGAYYECLIIFYVKHYLHVPVEISQDSLMVLTPRHKLRNMIINKARCRSNRYNGVHLGMILQTLSNAFIRVEHKFGLEHPIWTVVNTFAKVDL